MTNTLVALLSAVGDSGGPNLWGALGCAVAYAGAVLAGVDGIGDYVLARGQHTDLGAKRALRLKMGSKVAAAFLTVVTAAVVLILDSNWFAFAALSLAFVGIMIWVFFVSRSGGTAEKVAPPTGSGR